MNDVFPAGDIDERKMVREILGGDESAQRLFVDRYLHRLHEFIFYRCDRDDEVAEEVTQEVCARALERLSRFRGEAGLYTWLCAIAKHTLADRIRRRPAQPVAVFGSKDALVALADSIDRLLWEHDPDDAGVDATVSMAMTSLPPHYQDVLWAKYVEEETLETMARRRGMTEKGIGSLIVRAREAFKEAFRSASRETEVR